MEVGEELRRPIEDLDEEGHAVLHLRDRDGSEYYIHPHPGEGE
jgi:hypothetical protein